jgi:'Cold-shock' DNA-binding domain
VNGVTDKRSRPTQPRGRAKAAAIDPQHPRGTPATGKIVKLLVGQGHGYIRLADRRDIYFHRADVSEGTPFNEFAVGDVLTFEVLEDRFSGPRALSVRRSAPR